jgi:LysR family glycine cleavage system transcriptional activator
MPPFRSLVAFDAAARLGSFSRAAEELSLTQSAISQQLLKLEELLGQSLFFRRGKGVALTAAGELLHETVRETLARLAAGLDRIEPYKSRDSVLVACPPDVAQGWLLPRMPHLRRQLPGVEFWLITERSVREIDRIDVDLVISRRPIHTADVECTPLLEDYAIAICGAALWPDLRRAPYPKILEQAPVLLLEAEPAWAGRLAGSELQGTRVVRSATMDDSRLLLEAVARNLGIGYISHALAQHALHRGEVHMLPQVPTQSRPRLWLMRTRLAPRTAFANQAFRSLLAAAKDDFVI